MDAAATERGIVGHDEALRAAFPLNIAAPGQARTFVTEVLERLGLEGLVEDATLLVSELATNALRHAGGEQIDIMVLPEDGRVVFRVFDADAVLPRGRKMPRIDPTDLASVPEGGLGLAIIEAIAASWGRCRVPGGKWTWFSLATAEAST